MNYDPNKGNALKVYLESKQVKVPFGMGWKQTRCVNAAYHTHNDMTPSASVHLGMGRYKCHACGLSGDVYDLMVALGDAPDLKTALKGKIEAKEESAWI